MSNTIEFYLNNPIIQHDVGIQLVKDNQHRFVASNPGFSAFSGFKPDRIVGLCDSDMPWGEQASIYVSHERDILAGLDYSVIEPLPGLKRVNLVTQKTIIYDQFGVRAGTMATAVPLMSNIEFGNLAGTSDILRVADYGLNLTKKESLVLYYLLKGYKRSDIAERAQITTASYDFHMRSIRHKFGVSSSQEVIAAAYERGLHHTVPFVIKR